MHRRVADPELLPASVARHSVAVDLYDADADLSVAFPGLSLPERLRGAVRKRHIEHLAGRWCAREALRRHHPHHACFVVHTDDERAPVWPDGLVGSITHTQGFASAAVARREDFHGLGIDTEQRFTLDRAQRLHELIAAPGERARLLTVAELPEADAITVMFSAKESLYKCLHPTVRRYFGFHAAELVELGAGRFVVRLREALSPALPEGWTAEGTWSLDAEHAHTALALPRGG